MSAGPHTINFDADYTITLITHLPNIQSGTTVTIVGNGWDRTIIDGGNPPGGSGGARAFSVNAGGALVLDGVGIQNCYTPGGGAVVIVDSSASFLFLNSRAEANTSVEYGGAIFSYGSSSVVVQKSLITGNRATEGGGISFTGNVTIEDTTISGNISTMGGGGGVTSLWNSGNLVVRRSVFQDNMAESGYGGGIKTVSPLDQMTIENSTFVGNTASEGGAIWCEDGGNAALYGVTLTSNQGTTGGGISCPDVELEGSIVSGNTASSGPDLWGNIESMGYNLIGDTSGATISGDTTGNIVGVDPELGPLAKNGGVTKTCALLEGSPAIDTGPPGCGGLTTDQRGYLRPIDGDKSGTSECDIGAFEFNGTLFEDGFESGDTTGWSSTVP